MGRRQIRMWYLDVVSELERLPDAIEYYYSMIQDGEQYLTPKGNLESLLAGQAGLLYYYQSPCDDAEKIEKWLEEYIDYKKSVLYRWFQSQEGKDQYGDLKATDLKNYIESHDDIRSLRESLFYIESARRSLSTLCERLKERGIYLSMISKLRAAGQVEIMIDASQESSD